MIKSISTLFIMVMVASSFAWGQEVRTTTTRITAEDLKAHPVGAKVKELNERMRKVGEDAESHEKGSDSYILLKEGFEKLKKERDKVGEDIRGLRDFEVVLYGDRAADNSQAVKQAVIDFYIRNPSQRHMQPFHAYFDKNGNGPIVATAAPNPADVEGVQQAQQKPQQTQPQKPPRDWTLAPGQDAPPPNPDNCVCILGQCPPGC